MTVSTPPHRFRIADASSNDATMASSSDFDLARCGPDDPRSLHLIGTPVDCRLTRVIVHARADDGL
jgi:hypothetical protein